MQIKTINPATEEIIKIYSLFNEEEINRIIHSVHNAQLYWKKTSVDQRKAQMFTLADLLEQKASECAALIAMEMGKPIHQGLSEIKKCAWLCRHYAKESQAYLKPRSIKTEMKSSKVCYQPLGIVLAIMPWNFPFWQVFRCAVPAIMAGNAVLLKHAPITTGSGFMIEALFKEAGFVENIFRTLVLDNEAAAKVIAHEEVSAISFTGSEEAGRIVAAQAAKHVKKSVLELGGCDPYLVLDDADLDWAAQCIVNSRLNNSGQVCIAAKRVLVVQSVEKALKEKIIELMKNYTMGDPNNPSTTMGPLARNDLRDKLINQVENSLKQGANLLVGGIIPKVIGYYYPPTLVDNVKPGMTAFEEELFGPVISIVPVQDESQAISYANLGPFGLGAAVFTKDIKKGALIAEHEIHSGVCFVNNLVASDPRLPFGGIKHSGYGRELSKEGILEFVNIKTISISES